MCGAGGRELESIIKTQYFTFIEYKYIVITYIILKYTASCGYTLVGFCYIVLTQSSMSLGVSVSDFKWCEDKLHDVRMPLMGIDKLWDAQCFTDVSPERTSDIVTALKQAKCRLDELIDELTVVEGG